MVVNNVRMLIVFPASVYAAQSAQLLFNLKPLGKRKFSYRITNESFSYDLEDPESDTIAILDWRKWTNSSGFPIQENSYSADPIRIFWSPILKGRTLLPGGARDELFCHNV